jgi:tetratricopeptide (TPR) repeat protein
MTYLTNASSRMGATALPIKNYSLPVNKDNIKASGILVGRDSILESAPEKITFTLPRDYALKNDLAVLNILAANEWRRPIYFANSIDQNHYEGLGEYLEMEGLVFKLVPYKTPNSNTISPLAINTEKCFDWATKNLKFGNAQKGSVYFDQTNRRMLNGIRIACLQLADNYVRMGQKDKAIAILDHVQKNIDEKSYPVAITQEDKAMILIADNYMKAGATKQAEVLCDKLIKYSNQQADYFNTLSARERDPNSRTYAETDFCKTILNFLAQSAQMNNMKPLSEKLQKALQELSKKLPNTPGQ